MRRRRGAWTIAAGLVAVLATFAAWPKADRYGYLRALNPSVTYDRTEGSPGNPSVPTIEFEFHESYARVRELLKSHGAAPEDPEDQEDKTSNGEMGTFTTTDGKLMMLVSEASRTPPTSLT